MYTCTHKYLCVCVHTVILYWPIEFSIKSSFYQCSSDANWYVHVCKLLTYVYAYVLVYSRLIMQFGALILRVTHRLPVNNSVWLRNRLTTNSTHQCVKVIIDIKHWNSKRGVTLYKNCAAVSIYYRFIRWYIIENLVFLSRRPDQVCAIYISPIIVMQKCKYVDPHDSKYWQNKESKREWYVE